MNTLDAALSYHNLGWSVLPIKPGSKLPAVKSWKPFQRVRADDKIIREWFSRKAGCGLAVILGEVSDGLICRDFDSMAAFEAWAKTYPRLARMLPTVATSRGRHVYCRGDVKQIPPHSGSGEAHIVNFGDGELRGGGYSILPPSTHPKGDVYRWIIPVKGELPRLDLKAAGFLTVWSHATESSREDGRQLKNTETTEAIKRGGETSFRQLGNEDLQSQIAAAIENALPAGPGQRNRQVFELARGLKAIPALADAEALSLKESVREWHRRALPHISTKAFEETLIDFLRAWPRVKFPKGSDSMSRLFEAAMASALPAEAEVVEGEKPRILLALCRELQRASGTNPFFLSCRTAGRLLEVEHTTAWRWLFLFEQLGILAVETRGNQKSRQASRYRYLARL